MDILPCRHERDAVTQIEPAAELLKNLDTRHPDILLSAGVIPEDYHAKKVFRSAVETIRGRFIASSITSRHALVRDALERLKQGGAIADFEHTGGTKRYDFEVLFTGSARAAAAIEVKGGEGNSINISERPIWAEEFLVWCHLDGAIANQPAHGAYAIIFNRVTSELVRRGKRVDAVLIRDALCGTPLRPCPKYARPIEAACVAPDIFLFPQRVPTAEDPKPPVHSLDGLHLPRMLLQSFGVGEVDYDKHVWEVHVELFQKPTSRGDRLARRTAVYHQQKKLDERESYV